MGFKFQVHRATTIAGVTTLDGTLVGRLTHGARATARTGDGGTVAITVNTVAFVDSKNTGDRLTTITVEAPAVPVKTLEGLSFVGD